MFNLNDIKNDIKANIETIQSTQKLCGFLNWQFVIAEAKLIKVVINIHGFVYS